MTRSRAVVGIDPSLTSTGVAVAASPVRVQRIESKGSADATWPQRHDRITAIATRIAEEVPPYALVVIEAPSYGSVGGAAFDRTGLWWATYHLLHARRCWIVPAAPSQRSKYATGNGRAPKDAVLAAAVRRYPDIDINGNDIADAVVLMAIGCRLLGQPIDDPIPVLNLSALTKLTLPEEA